MEKYIDKIFSLKKIPGQLVFVIWISSFLLAILPKSWLDKFMLTGFKNEYEKFIGPNIKGICSEKNFYTLDEDSKVAENVLAVEKVYSDFIEPMYAKAYDILTNDNIININFMNRASIIIGVMQFFSRNPANLLPRIEEHKEKVTNLYAENVVKGIKGLTYFDEDYSFRDFTLESILKDIEAKVITSFKEYHLQATNEIVGFHEDAKLQVFKLNDGSRYFSGDNPLIIRDLLDGNREILKRSKEFTIPLNNYYALRISHDNRLLSHQIHKSHSSNVSGWLINQDIIKQSSRFIITDEKSINDYKELAKIMNSRNLGQNIDLIRQIVKNFKDDNDTIKQRKNMEEFLVRYDAGITTPEDEKAFFQQLKDSVKDFSRNRIK